MIQFLSVFFILTAFMATSKVYAAGVNVTGDMHKKNTTKESSYLSGGGATVFAQGRNAFSLPSANIPLLEKLDFNVGNSFFRNPWVIAPASTDARDGLGPLFNANGCQNCHIKDGRGHAPDSPEDNAVSLLVRLSIPERLVYEEPSVYKEPSANQEPSAYKESSVNKKISAHKKNSEIRRKIHQGTVPEPTYGGQLQDFSIPGVKPEGRIRIDYSDVVVNFDDGEIVVLRKPALSITQLAYGAMHPNVQLSARIAPPMIGLGLLEAIEEEQIRHFADPSDSDSNGISGRVNEVWSPKQKKLALGRFGWKAGQPSVLEQNAGAFNGDLGITSTLLTSDDCSPAQKKCRQATNGNGPLGEPEVSDKILNFVTFYSKNLAVPARRDVNKPSVKLGERLFTTLGCAVCHRPTWKTSANYSMTWLANQTIHPYTDLLLHDMGEGLADNRPEFEASGREWRTSPLWGIGLSKVVSKKASFLHDGRARNLQEAVLWHGGEAQQSQEAFIALPKSQRNALIDFLNSL
jgi:CxxC motif-containing protein (DUF1111 family)